MTHDPRRPFTARGGAAGDLRFFYLARVGEDAGFIKNDSNF